VIARLPHQEHQLRDDTPFTAADFVFSFARIKTEFPAGLTLAYRVS
jgi:hypothetical protein